MTVYESEREATGNEIEARIQKDGSLGLHFSLISGNKWGNGFRFFAEYGTLRKEFLTYSSRNFTIKPASLQAFFANFQYFQWQKAAENALFLPKSLEFSRVSSENRSQNFRQISRLYIIVIIINLFQETNY